MAESKLLASIITTNLYTETWLSTSHEKLEIDDRVFYY
jgi:hypothetical protein